MSHILSICCWQTCLIIPKKVDLVIIEMQPSLNLFVLNQTFLFRGHNLSYSCIGQFEEKRAGWASEENINISWTLIELIYQIYSYLSKRYLDNRYYEEMKCDQYLRLRECCWNSSKMFCRSVFDANIVPLPSIFTKHFSSKLLFMDWPNLSIQQIISDWKYKELQKLLLVFKICIKVRRREELAFWEVGGECTHAKAMLEELQGTGGRGRRGRS